MIFSSIGSCSVKSSSSHVIFGDYSFRVLEAEIHESLSSLFKISCHCYYEGLTNAPFGEDSSDFLLGGDVLFCLNSPDRSRLHDKKLSVSDIKSCKSEASFSPEKVFRGIISEFSYDGNSYSDGSSGSSDVKSLKRRHYYHFTITSPLYKLSLNQCYRIFTSVSVPDVIKSVLERYSGFLNKEYDFSNIFNSYPPSEYISQYNESDLHFLERLCLNNGVYFYEDEEKVYEEEIKNDFTQTIDMNKQSTVKGGYIENIAMAHMQNIGLGKSVNVVAEYITVVGASKDTAVGLSNTLNVGVSNMVNVGEDSSESIGGDKNVSVGGDLKEIVNGGRKEVTMGDVERKTEDLISETSESGINIVSKKHYNVNVEEDLDYFSKKNITLNAKEHISFDADSVDIDLKSEYSVKASEYSVETKDKIEFKIGNAEISSDGSLITLKVGGVEVTIYSQGLKLKNGKLSVE